MRTLTAEDAPEVGALLARAFVEDPPVVWFFPEPAEREDRMRSFFTASARAGLTAGTGVMTEEGGAVGLFLPPGASDDDAVAAAAGVPQAIEALGPDRAEKVGRFLTTLGELHGRTATEPGWVLNFVGSLPEARGSGQAACIIDELSRRAHESGHPCFLDTLSEWNVGYYERRGYRVVAEADVPDSPIHGWGMRRD